VKPPFSDEHFAIKNLNYH